MQLPSTSINNDLVQANLIPSQDSLLHMSLDDDFEEIFNISTNNDSNVNKKSTSTREFLKNFLEDNQQSLNSKTITLLFPYDNPEELFFWAKYATVEDLLKSPSITYINER